MPRKFFRKYMPSREKVDSERLLRWLRPIMNRPYLWHLNRHSVARGVGWGLFWALIPMPGQSIPAVLCTVWSRGNLPLAIAATWMSNPFTLIPHWWSAYIIGKFVLRSDGLAGIQFTWDYWKDRWHDWQWLLANFWSFYLPLLVGSIIEGILVGGLAYLVIMGLWRRHSANRWRTSRWRARPAGVIATPERSPAPERSPEGDAA